MTSELLFDLDEVFSELLQCDIGLQLPGGNIENLPSISTEDIHKLIGYSSILALDENPDSKRKAYEICTRLIEITEGNSKSIIESSDVILSRLGNFPGRQLLRDRYTEELVTPLAPPLLWFERSVREIENTIFTGNDKTELLTDFQFQLFDELSKKQTVSVSAPTSAGKSFILGLDLLRRISSSKKPQSIVYIVPTRALIREVSIKFRDYLKKEGLSDIPIRTVPLPIDKEKAPLGVIYVLTQERLMSLLYTTQGVPWVSTLFIDEAHGIQDKSRGIILESSIDATLVKFPDIELHFASPLISNPEIFPAIFNRPNSKNILETFSPVSQNIILVSEVDRKTKQAKFELFNKNNPLNLGVRSLSFKFRGAIYKLKANFANAVTKEKETTIIFANGAVATEKLAEELTKITPKSISIDDDIQDLIDFIKNEIHPDYLLIEALKYQVAFHYGNMPTLIRTKVEDLVKEGKIRFICCTSTLLQGVNLPAKHIIIDNPKSGNSDPMTRQDFLNLIGRAGRLQYEFHGNIWCLNPTNWSSQPFKGEVLQKVEPAMNHVMANGGLLIQELLDKGLEGENDALAETAFSKFYSDFIFPKSSLEENKYLTAENKEELADTLEKCRDLHITIPQEVLDSNIGIRPDRLQALYVHLSSILPLIDLEPMHPKLSGYYKRMEEIIEVTQKHLEGKTNDSYKYYANLAAPWVHGTSTKEMISNNILYNKENRPDKNTMKVIRELFDGLNNIVRFKLVKNFMAYTSVLAVVMREKGMEEEADSLEPFHLYLECGASDPTALNLISIGLSRTTALSLIGSISFVDAESPEECLKVLGTVDLLSLSIPKICIKEIQALL